MREITEALDCDDEALPRHLLGVVKSGILRKPGKGKELSQSTEFSLNQDFKSRLFRLQLTVLPVKRNVEEQATEELPPTIEEDRKHTVDACLVRVLKTRRQILHCSLIEEVSRLASERFCPDKKLLKERIESLMEREYIERDTHNPLLYKYIV